MSIGSLCSDYDDADAVGGGGSDDDDGDSFGFSERLDEKNESI